MNKSKKHILLIDDDKEITSLIAEYLKQHDFKVTVQYDGARLLKLLNENNFDLIILDVMLPGQDGLSLCQQIRNLNDIPVLMLSAAQSEADRVSGLEVGADDYIVKPFSSRELLARIKAHLRRNAGELVVNRQKLAPLKKIKFDSWILNRETHTLIGSDQVALALSQREYEMLMIFLEHPNRILSRNQLMDLLYDRDLEPTDRSIDVLIGRIRKKIEPDPRKPSLLKTIRGGGYQFKSTVESI